MANALPNDFLSQNILKTLELQAEVASAAYADGTRPDGFKDVNIEKLGVDPGSIDGPFFENGDAVARVMKKDGDFYIAFRGTDDPGDFFDYLDIEDDYIQEFDQLLNEISDDISGKLYVTGHSLGAAAVHQLQEDKSQYGKAYQNADYFSFGSPIFDNPAGVAVYGHANDAIYGIAEDGPPPYVSNVFWYRDDIGIETPDATDEENEAPHSIDNMADGLDRIMGSDVFRPEFGLVEKRGLDLSVTTIITGSHDDIVMPDADDLAGTMVLLGVDGRLPTESKAQIDRSDVIFGRDIAGSKDWIDGMSGDDRIEARAGDDRLIGGDGADVLKGGAGADVIYGGANKDDLSGGKGADRFVFSDRQDNADVVLDFSKGQNDVLAIDVGTFGGSKGELDIVNGGKRPDPDGGGETALYARSSGKLFYDPDGDGNGDAVLIAVLKDGPDKLQGDDVILV